MAEAKEPENLEGAEGSFFSHLLELRNRLLYAVIAVGVVFVALVPFADHLYALIASPLMAALPAGATMIATEVTSPFLTPLKFAFVLAFVLAIPYVLYQIWAFVAPGLYRRERRLILPLIVSSTVLFYAGMAFAYFAVFPLMFQFFVSTAPPGVTVMTDIRAYVDFVLAMFLVFGVAFEVPVALVLLTRMGVVNPDSLAKKRPYVVLWVFVIAAILTPPDVFSQTFLAVPTLLLFEIGLFIARRVRPREHAEDDAGRPLSGRELDAELARHEQALSAAGAGSKRRRRKRKKK
jgi:sec-independent protein translocase protein TatC